MRWLPLFVLRLLEPQELDDFLKYEGEALDHVAYDKYALSDHLLVLLSVRFQLAPPVLLRVVAPKLVDCGPAAYPASELRLLSELADELEVLVDCVFELLVVGYELALQAALRHQVLIARSLRVDGDADLRVLFVQEGVVYVYGVDVSEETREVLFVALELLYLTFVHLLKVFALNVSHADGRAPHFPHQNRSILGLIYGVRVKIL